MKSLFFLQFFLQLSFQLHSQFLVQFDFNGGKSDKRLLNLFESYKEPSRYSGAISINYKLINNKIISSIGLGYHMVYSTNPFYYKDFSKNINGIAFHNVTRMLQNNVIIPIEASYPLSKYFSLNFNANNIIGITKKYSASRLSKSDIDFRFEGTDIQTGFEFKLKKAALILYIRSLSIKSTNEKIYFSDLKRENEYEKQVGKVLDVSNPLLIGFRIKRNLGF